MVFKAKNFYNVDNLAISVLLLRFLLTRHNFTLKRINPSLAIINLSEHWKLFTDLKMGSGNNLRLATATIDHNNNEINKVTKRQQTPLE